MYPRQASYISSVAYYTCHLHSDVADFAFCFPCPPGTGMNAQVLQWCPTLCDPMDCSLPGSSVHQISQTRILEWVAISFLQGIFPAQGSNWYLLCRLHWQADSLPLSQWGSLFGFSVRSHPGNSQGDSNQETLNLSVFDEIGFSCWLFYQGRMPPSLNSVLHVDILTCSAKLPFPAKDFPKGENEAFMHMYHRAGSTFYPH